MGEMRTYIRPMSGWWRRNPFYGRYMVREVSSLFVTIYALILLTGLWRLAQGEAAYDAWRAALASPWSLAFHALTLVFFVYHAYTWFEVMPKTMPFLRIGGSRVSDRGIVAAGATAAVVLSLLLFAWVSWVVR